MEWEYDWFGFNFDYPGKGLEMGREGLSEHQMAAWTQIKNNPEFIKTLQDRLSAGWEPITSIGPADIQFQTKTVRKHDNDVLSWITNPIGNLLFTYEKTYITGITFKVQVRRQK